MVSFFLPFMVSFFLSLQYLIKETCQEVLLVTDGLVKRLDGGVEEYVELLAGKGKKQGAARGKGGLSGGGGDPKKGGS
jgi:hypothetical protein